jgi:hypothetical protein
MAIFAGANLTGVYTTAELTQGATPSLGDIFFGEGNKVYKFVKYNDGTANLDLAAGDVVYYVDDSGYGAHTVTADVSDSTGAEIGAGVAVTAVTDDASCFWIQIKGMATTAVALGGSAGDGDPLTAVGAADKALTKAAEADTAATYKAVVAFAIDASAQEIICDFPF